MKFRIVQRFFFAFSAALLSLLSASNAQAHGAFDCSSEMTVHEHKIEIAITMGLEAARTVLAKAGLSSEAIADAIKTRGPHSSVDLSPTLSSSFFELNCGEEKLAAQSIAAISDGVEVTFHLIYPRPTAGTLDARAVYHNGIEEIRRGPFIAHDEAMNQLGAAVLSRMNTSLQVLLPAIESKSLVVKGASATEKAVQPVPSLKKNRSAVIWWFCAPGIFLIGGWLVARNFLNRNRTVLIALIIFATAAAHAQRQMEPLGRGVIAMRTGNSTAYIGWRLLATDPEDVGFNIYRSQNGGAAVKLNAQPITNTTDFVDSTATLSQSNAWLVCAVTNGVEAPFGAPFGIAANAPVPLDFQGKVAPYLSIPLQPIAGGNYYTHHCWPGDLDGDGEYDFVVSRLPNAGGVCYLDAYLRNGTFLWRMNMGYNSTNLDGIEPGSSAISVGHGDNVTVFDMDGDGRAEVLVRTSNGVTVTNAAGVQVASITAGSDVTQFLSVIDGLTGVERARAVVPNPYSSEGPLNGHMGIMFCDGKQPSVVFEGANRTGSAGFNYSITTWDFRNGQLTQRWTTTLPGGGNKAKGHQIRIADVDHDGKDELCEIGFVLDDNGQVLFDTELIHGDRYHIADLDPDRPGLETFAIQQDNPTLMATALYDSLTGKMIKKWYASGIVDVGRGNAGEVDQNSRGVELWSTQPGLYSAKGDFVSSTLPATCNFSIWWDADLAREQLDDGKIDKYGVGRVMSPYSLSALSTWRNAQPLYGDLFGDWREEILYEKSDYSQLMIFTPVSPATNRIVCLAQDPEYRECMTVKGYMQSTWPSFYIGAGMGKPPVQPISDAQLVWRSDGVTNDWDDSVTANWFTNNLWISNNTPVVFVASQSVLFDVSGSNNTAINLVGTLMPGAVKVHSPTDYIFSGGTLDGSMTLTKAGAGTLTLNNTNTFTGRTLISEGSLIVNGELPSSPVVVRSGAWLDGRIGGNGNIGAGVTIEQGGGVSPGFGTNSSGTLTISNALTLRGGTLNDFDLSDDPTNITKTNDLVNVIGNVVLQGANKLVIRELDDALTPGSYTLIRYSGTLSGSLNNLSVAGFDGIPFTLTNPPGVIALVIQETRPPVALAWTGGSGGNGWDLTTTSNWLNGALKDEFSPLDAVRFDATGTSNLTVNLIGSLNPGSVIVDSTANYNFNGAGAIIGTTGLVKTNSGTLTINANANTFTGRTIIGGGTLAINDLDMGGFPSSLGAANASPTNIVMYNGSTLKFTGYGSFTDRGITLNSGTNTINISTISGAATMTIAGQLVGAGALLKDGSGQLNLNASNTYSGGTILKAGTLQLGTQTANQYGLGSGVVTFNGGTLSMENTTGSDYDGTFFTGPWNMVVPVGMTGRLNAAGRCSVTGTLTGGGTLTVWVPFVRADFSGNWAGFTNQINIIADSDGGDFRCNNSAGYPNAKISIGVLASLQNRIGSTPTIPIGEISGVTGSIINAPGGNGGIGVNWRVGGLNTTATFAGNTYNNVGFIKEGTGTWIWTGTNTTHTGQTTINGGALQIGNGGTSGMLGPGNVTDNSLLVFNRSDSISDTNFGTISGTGNLVKRGAGTLTLSKAHTYSGTTTIETGTLALTSTGSVANSSNIILSANALFDVSGTTSGSMTLGLGKMISGNGSVKGNFLVGATAKLSPGTNSTIGTLTFSNSLACFGGFGAPPCTNFFKISKSPTANDSVRVFGSLTNGGFLLVTNISANAFAAGDTFRLFNASSYSGSIQVFILPPLAAGLMWDTSTVNTNGTIKVINIPPPVISGIALSETNLIVSGSNGVANSAYYVLTSTNLSLPLAQWTRIATNHFDTSGGFSFTNEIGPGAEQLFYQLQLP
jgi:fibronectin-binding autotransporter adhesin